MSAKPWMINFLVCVLMLGGTGCKKKEPSPLPPAVDTGKAMDAVGDEQPGMAEAAKQAGENAGGESAQPAPLRRATAQDLIDRAKGLIATNQYREALFALRQAAVFRLTTEQRKMVEDLRQQIQQGLARKATGGPQPLPAMAPAETGEQTGRRKCRSRFDFLSCG